MHTLIGHGAEAVVYHEGERAIKQRTPKGYRLPALDTQLRKLRTRAEARILEKVQKAGIRAPVVHSVCEQKMEVQMEFLEGPKVRDALDANPLVLGKAIGETVGRLHNADVAHQDLTTSNMILHNGEIALIDFGLSFVSRKVEDKAVDLHLLERALSAKHSAVYDTAWGAVVTGYQKTGKKANEVLKRYTEVKKRGRNKPQY